MLMEGVFHKTTKHTIQDSTGTKVHRHPQQKHSTSTPGHIVVNCGSLWSILVFPPSLCVCPQHRYVVFHVEFQVGCLRRYDSQGKEIEANLGQTGLVRTGYLHSSYSEAGWRDER